MRDPTVFMSKPRLCYRKVRSAYQMEGSVNICYKNWRLAICGSRDFCSLSKCHCLREKSVHVWCLTYLLKYLWDRLSVLDVMHLLYNDLSARKKDLVQFKHTEVSKNLNWRSFYFQVRTDQICFKAHSRRNCHKLALNSQMLARLLSAVRRARPLTGSPTHRRALMQKHVEQVYSLVLCRNVVRDCLFFKIYCMLQKQDGPVMTSWHSFNLLLQLTARRLMHRPLQGIRPLQGNHQGHLPSADKDTWDSSE